MLRRSCILLALLAYATCSAQALPPQCADYSAQTQLTQTAAWSAGWDTHAVAATDALVLLSVRSSDTFPYTHNTRVFEITETGDVEFRGTFGNGIVFEGAAADGAIWCGFVSSILTVADLSDPTSVHVGGSTAPLGDLTDIVVRGTIAYLTAEAPPQLIAVDVSDVAMPSPVGNVPTAGSAVELAVSNDVAYVADGPAGLTIVDVGVPASPAVLTTLLLAHDAAHVAVAHGLAFVTGGGMLTVVDVSTPSAPVTRATIPVRGERVAAGDGRAFLAAASDGLEIVDVTDPDTPTPQGFIVVPGFSSGVLRVDVIGQRLLALGEQGSFSGVFPQAWLYDIGPPIQSAYITQLDLASPRWVETTDSHAYVLAPGELNIVDISDVNEPQLLGSASWVEETVRGLALAGTRAYVAQSSTGGAGALVILDISDPTDPTFLGAETSGGTADVVFDVFAYCARDYGLDIVDATSVANPFVVGTWSGGIARHIAVHEDLAFLTMEHGGVVNIVDVSSPASPVLAGDFFAGSSAGDIAVRWPYAYVATGDGVAVADVSNPAAPGGAWVLGSTAVSELSLVTTTLYATFGDRTAAIDVTNPGAPTLIGMMPLDSRDVAASEERVVAIAHNHLVLLRPQCSGVTPVQPLPGGGMTPQRPDGVRVHPSPVSTWATLRYTPGDGLRPPSVAYVMDVGGRRVGTIALIRSGRDVVGRWDAGDVAPGVYFIRLEGKRDAGVRVVRLD